MSNQHELSPDEYKSIIRELRQQVEDVMGDQSALELRYESQLEDMARVSNEDAQVWDRERAQLTELIQQTLERQKEFNEQLHSQRSAWDEMAAIKEELEVENDRLKNRIKVMETDARRAPGAQSEADRIANSERMDTTIQMLAADLNQERERRMRAEDELEVLRSERIQLARHETTQEKAEEIIELELERARADLMAMRSQLISADQRCERLSGDLMRLSGGNYVEDQYREQRNGHGRARSPRRAPSQGRRERDTSPTNGGRQRSQRDTVQSGGRSGTKSRPLADKTFDDIDTNGDGVIERKEWNRAMKGAPTPEHKEAPPRREARDAEREPAADPLFNAPKSLVARIEEAMAPKYVEDTRARTRGQGSVWDSTYHHFNEGRVSQLDHRVATPSSPHRSSYSNGASSRGKLPPNHLQLQQARELEQETKRALKSAKEMAMRRVGGDGAEKYMPQERKAPLPMRPYSARQADRGGGRNGTPTTSRSSPSPRHTRSRTPTRRHDRDISPSSRNAQPFHTPEWQDQTQPGVRR